MNKIYTSPKRNGKTKNVKDQSEKSPKLKSELKTSSRSRPTLKRLSKSFKENLTARSGNLNVSGFSPRSPRINTEVSESSIKATENYSLSKSPKINLTDANQYSHDSVKMERSKNPGNNDKAKNLKNLKSKLLARIKRKESFSKGSLKIQEEFNKGESVKVEKKEKKEKKEVKEVKELKTSKKSGIKSQKKSIKKKKAPKNGKKGKSSNFDDKSLSKKKEKILKRLSELNDRINSFRLDAFVTCKNSWDHVLKSAIKIQATIRGFLVRKIFSQTLRRLKENRLRNIEIDRLKNEHLGQVEKHMHMIQLKSLMEMRENDLQEVSEILKNCENVGHIKKNLEEIINRRYIVLSRSMGNLPHLIDDLPIPFKIKPESFEDIKIVEEIKIEPRRIPEKKFKPSPRVIRPSKTPEKDEDSHKDPEKTPKKQVNIRECEIIHNREFSVEFLCEPISFPNKSLAQKEISLDTDPARLIFNSQPNPESEKLKLKRIIFELEVFVFELLFKESIYDLCKESDNNYLLTTKTKVPIRYFNIFSNTVQHFSTDQYSLMSYLNKTLLYNKTEKILTRVKKYWSPFRILFKLDNFLLEKFRGFQYFTEDSSLRGDKLKKIYSSFQLDVINEAFSLCINGLVPTPWVYNFEPVVDFDLQIKKLRKKLVKWAEIEAGKVPDLGMLSVLGLLNEDALQTARETNLEKVVNCDMEEDHEIWSDLKYHETGLVLCLEDDILVDLVLEAVGLF